MGPDVVLIDSGQETASFAMELLREQNALCDRTESGRCSFFVSDSTEGFSKAASMFLERDVADDVNYIDIVAFAESHANQTESES